MIIYEEGGIRFMYGAMNFVIDFPIYCSESMTCLRLIFLLAH